MEYYKEITQRKREKMSFFFFWVILLSDSYGIQYYNT